MNLIVVVETPFHYLVFKKYLLKVFKSCNFIVLYSSYIKLDVSSESNIVEFVKLPESNLRFASSIFFNINLLRKAKRYQQNCKSIVQYLKNKYYFETVITFNDRQILNQMLMSVNKKGRNILIDEGVGLYRKHIEYSYRHFVYMFSSLLFNGFKLSYSNRLGDYIFVNEIHARCPELIDKKRVGVIYKKFNVDFNDSKIILSQISNKQKNILFLSTTLSEDCICSLEREKVVLNKLFTYFVSKGYCIYLKPHPRENIQKYDDFVCQFYLDQIPRHISFEQLDLKQFDAIFSFMSSSIIELYSVGFPTHSIFTYYLPGNDDLKYLFSQTVSVNNEI